MHPIVNLVLGLAVTLGPAAAQGDPQPALYPHEEMNHWGRWGKEDERGAANFITPAAIVRAAGLIRTGRTFSLAIPLDQTGPVYPPRLPPHHTMTITGADFASAPSLSPFGDSFIRFADDYIYMALQGSSQWDGLSHAWYGDKLYNGFPQEAIRSAPSAGGATRLGIENVKDGLVGRGILIDVLRFKGGKLPPGYGITRADLEEALKAPGTEVRSGDIVLVRTGRVPLWYTLKNAAEREEFLAGPKTGLTSDVVPWIREHEIAAVAADSMAMEQIPNQFDEELFVPLHGNLLRDLGVYIGEIWWLEELAADCAKDERYEFFLAAQPLNITGAVGTPVNPIAIK